MAGEVTERTVLELLQGVAGVTERLESLEHKLASHQTEVMRIVAHLIMRVYHLECQGGRMEDDNERDGTT